MPSTVIADIEYDDERELLTVTFTTGRVYQYFEVPFDIAAAFQSAFSKGTFFNKEIRDKYLCREMTPGLS